MQVEPHPEGPGSNERGVSVEPLTMTSRIALCQGDVTPLSSPLLAGWPCPSQVPQEAANTMQKPRTRVSAEGEKFKDSGVRDKKRGCLLNLQSEFGE